MNERIISKVSFGDDNYLVTIGHQCNPDSEESKITTIINSFRQTSSKAKCQECHGEVRVIKDVTLREPIYIAQEQ